MAGAVSFQISPRAAISSLRHAPSTSYTSVGQQGSLRVHFQGLRICKPMTTTLRLAASPRTSRVSPATTRTVSMALQEASLPVLTYEGEKSGETFIDLKVANVETARSLVHRGVITEMQNRRRGTASTLTRSEVRGGGRKPYKQKGTGGARRGSQRTPLRPGGGVVFGPKPVDWRIKINKKEKQLSISTALQSAAVNMVVVEDFEDKFEKPKTKDIVAALKRWGLKPEVEHLLFFTMELNEPLYMSLRNLKRFSVITPRNLNIYDILRADKLVLTKSTVDYLNEVYGSSQSGGDFEEEEMIIES